MHRLKAKARIQLSREEMKMICEVIYRRRRQIRNEIKYYNKWEDKEQGHENVISVRKESQMLKHLFNKINKYEEELEHKSIEELELERAAILAQLGR